MIMKPLPKEVYKSGPITLFEIETERGIRLNLDMGSDAVLIIPITPSGNYVLVSQLRPGKDIPTLEFPSGGIKAGETPEQAAVRELLEEVGSTVPVQFLGVIEPLSGIVRFNVHVFLANIEEPSAGHMSPEPGEKLQLISLSKEKFIEKVATLDVVDGYVACALGLLAVRTKLLA